MDSINKNQPEHNHEDLFGAEAIERLQDMVKSADTCFFCTNIQQGKALSTRPMSVQKVDDQGNFWLVSPIDSEKNAEIALDPAVQMLFQGSQYSDFLTVYGTASITTDRAKIEELWEPLMRTWFTEGQEDPRISVIKVKPTEGYYWDNKSGNAIALIKTAFSALVGKTYDDSIEGELVV